MMERIATIVPRALTALFLAVALSLPNYSAAFEAWRNQDDYLSSLYDQYLSEFGAQEAHAILPALAVPAGLAAAGVTTEMLAAASAAIFTAVAGVSLVASWDDLSIQEKSEWDGNKDVWTWAQNAGALGLAGYLVGGGQDDNGNQKPPEFKGDGGKKMEALLLALCTGSGVVVLKDLADAAGYLIDFVTSPAGEDENGFPTGLGVVVNPGQSADFHGYSIPVKLVSGSLSGGYSGIDSNNRGVTVFPYVQAYVNGYLCCFSWEGSVVSLAYQFASSSESDIRYSTLSLVQPPLSTRKPYVWSDSEGKWLSIYSSKYKDSNISLPSSDIYSALAYLLLEGSLTGEVYINSNNDFQIRESGGLILLAWDAETTTWTVGSGSLHQDEASVSHPSANIPSPISDMLQQVAQAGVGTEAAQQVVNNYVTNNIANSEKVVTVPSSLDDTADYDKVVRDPEPDPGGDPDPDPGSDETTAQKAEKLAKLPVQQLFPFCLIYDIQLLVEHVAGGSAAYSDGSLLFEFDVGFGYFDSPLVIDLTDYKDMRGAFHMAFDVMLAVGLLYFSISLFLKARSD